MKSFVVILCLVGLCTTPVPAQEIDPKPAPPQGAKAELEDLKEQIEWKMRKGQRTEVRLAHELKEFDRLLEKHAGEKTDDVAEILKLKAMLYVEVFDEPAKALPILRRMKEEFPETQQGRAAEAMIASVEEKAAAVKLRNELVEGKEFPEIDVKDMNGQVIRLSDYR